MTDRQAIKQVLELITKDNLIEYILNNLNHEQMISLLQQYDLINYD